MKRYWIAIAILLVAALFLGACGSAPSPQSSEKMLHEAPASAGAPMPEQPASASSVAVVSEDNGAQEPPADALLSDRKIIYNASIFLVVEDTEQTAQDVETMANSMGGYVASMNGYRQGERMLYDITIRIPAGQFNNSLAALRNLAVRVENENISTNDVTDQYYDIDARLDTLKATEKELTQLLKETRERGGKVEDIMKIYDRLIQLRSEIESLQGQLNRLDKLTAYSTIDIHLEPSILNQPIETKGWNPAETAKKSLQALISILTDLVNFLIALVIVVVPVAIIILLPLALVVWLIRRWQKRRKKV
ncbi:MAG: hypothetical protein DSY55_03115 [Clostridia bacterium]|nr:MAG: hypothetical protein DSY55_03115 [Clostridia bacterium]